MTIRPQLRRLAARHLRSWASIQRLVQHCYAILRTRGTKELWLSIRRAIEKDRHLEEDQYLEWIRANDTLTPTDAAAIKARIKEMTARPLISIVMPVYKTKVELLIQAIESVRAQLYPHWELCIADDNSKRSDIRNLLVRYQRLDSRIKVVLRGENGHISRASNSALELATGDWVALLDHDDLLAPHALYCVADAIAGDPGLRLIYSDEDKVGAKGNRVDHYFKPSWNPELFHSHNLISHLGCYRRDLITAVGGFREGFEGAQDYDLALRCIERIRPEQIHHIPHVLYHWRMVAGSTAVSADYKPYAMQAGTRALNEHFARQNVKAQATLIGFGYRVDYDLPPERPLVSIVMPTRNMGSLVETCVTSIRTKTTYQPYEIVLVDNGSDEPESLAIFAELEARGWIRIIRDNRPFNYSALNNAAVRQTRGTVLALLNNDVEVITPDWLSTMVSLALRPGVGAVGAKLFYPDNTIQHAGVIAGLGGVAGHAHRRFRRGDPGYKGRAALCSNFSAVTGACLVVQRRYYDRVGGLNENNLTVAFNDVDFCLRLWESGLRNIWTPHAQLYHHESASRGHETTPEQIARFVAEQKYMTTRWAGIFADDPAYNPNLTLGSGDFGLGFPPRRPKPWLIPRDRIADVAE